MPIKYKLNAGDVIDITAVTKNNQGAGSGLDSDLLDGLHRASYEEIARKGVANGYAPLGGDSKVPSSYLPALSHTVLSDIGTNTHAQIDTHLGAYSGVHGVGVSSIVGTDTTQTLLNKTFGSNTIIKEQGVADATIQQYDSYDFILRNSMWYGGAEVKRSYKIRNAVADPVNNWSKLLFLYENDLVYSVARQGGHAFIEYFSLAGGEIFHNYNTVGGGGFQFNIRPGNSVLNSYKPLYLYGDSVERIKLDSLGCTFSGEVGLAGGYFLLSNTSTLPTADSTYRGKMIRVQGGTGVADGFFICEKDSSGNFVWQLLNSDKIRTDLIKLGFRVMNGDNASAYNLAYSRLDEFRDPTGIDAGVSSAYTFRGTPNFDVIQNSMPVDESYIDGDNAQHDIPAPGYVNNDPTAGMLSQSGLSGWVAGNLIDDNITTTAFGCDGVPPGSYYQIDLGAGSEKAYRKYRFYSADAGPNLSTFKVRYSDNATTWTDAVTGLTAVSGAWVEGTWGVVGAHRYWRCELTSGPATGTQNIKEAEWYTWDVTYIAQSFTPSANATIAKVDLYLLKSGFPDGNVNVRIETDNANKPGGTIVGSAVAVAASSLGTAAGWVTFDVGDFSATGGTKYWIVLYRSGDTAGTVSWRHNTAGTYPGGSDGTSPDAGTTWVVDSLHDSLFKVYRVGSSTGTVISTPATVPTAPTNILVEWGETLGTGSITMFVSRDGGTTWTGVTNPVSISGADYNLKWKNVDVSAQPSGVSLKTKAEIVGNAELEAVGISW